jgi:hypothetical protein
MATTVCQTKSETEDFIKKYIEGNPQNNGAESEKNDVFFTTNDKGVYLMLYSNFITYSPQVLIIFEPSQIQSITIDKTTMKGQNIMIRIRMKDGAKAQKKIPQRNEEKYIDTFEIILGNSAFSDNIPDRLKKAIEHLSKLAGGGVTEDKF